MSFPARDPTDFLLTSVARFTLDTLIDSSRRKQLREIEKLKLLEEQGKDVVKYSDQAVLANLGWGIEALEEAILTTTTETKIARLEYAEQMLQVCALLDTSAKTGGVLNSYLAASAFFNLALVYKLRNDDKSSAKHILDMFLADPLTSRVDFAPGLWESLFQHHLTGITSWYTAQRTKLVVTSTSSTWDNNDYSCSSFSRDDFSVLDNLMSNVTSEQAEQLQVLENLYRNSLDDHTRQYAKYYKDWLLYGGDSGSRKKVSPLFPIAEPPMTPLYEFNSVPVRSQLHMIHEIEEEERHDNTVDSTNEITSPSSSKGERKKKKNKSLHRTGSYLRSSSLEKSLREQSPSSSRSSSEYSSPRKAATSLGSQAYEEKKKVKSLDFKGTLSPSSSMEKSLRKSSSSRLSLEYSSPSKGGFSEKLIDKVSKPVKTLQRANSKSLLEILQEDGVRISSPNTGYLVEKTEFNMELKVDTEDDPQDIEELLSPGSPESSLTDNGGLSQENCNIPPKDFVCPITNQIFRDPVTLETGQTYERTAIQEWLERGNTTCPITRQLLQSRILPRTNYVLKRLIEQWKDLHPNLSYESPLHIQYWTEELLPSNTIGGGQENPNQRDRSGGQQNGEAMQRDLKQAIDLLCDSGDLRECEEAVITISKVWETFSGDFRVEASLTKATVIEGLVEVLSVSGQDEVLEAAISILSALVTSDEFTTHTILRADPRLEMIRRLLKMRVSPSVVLLYQLKLQSEELDVLDIVPDLVSIIRNSIRNIGTAQIVTGMLSPKSAAIVLLQQLVSWSPSHRSNARSIVSLEAVPVLVDNLDAAKDMDEISSTVSILLCCMKADSSCRSLIATSANLRHVVEALFNGSSSECILVTSFFLELLHLNRRICIKVLETGKKEGRLSTMHMLLVYMHKVPVEHRHTIAMLLLQLDLLDGIRKESMYRDEAVGIIIEALNSQSFDCQVETAEALVGLVGRFSLTGAPLTEAWLLKTAGLESAYENLINEDPAKSGESLVDEEKAAKSWEFNVARALLEYEQGGIFEAIGTTLQSRNTELSKPSMIMAVWLTCMVKSLPDIGLYPLARRYFMATFIVTLESAKHTHQRVLAALGLHTFLRDSESFQELVYYAKDIIKPLRQLKKVTWIAQEFIEAFIKCSSLNPLELWQHGEVGQLDLSRYGEVRSLARSRGRLFSGHSDGTIQVWETKKKVPSSVMTLKEHSKAVTSLAVLNASNKLYSGSLDKTVRVWTIAPDSIHCINVLDMKEAVYKVAISGSTVAITTNANGIKVQGENLAMKQLNTNKNVECLAFGSGNIYCGCTDNSIQEVNPEEGSVVTIQTGTRGVRGKRPIYVIHVYKKEIFTGGSPVEGVSVKVWDQTDYSLKRVIQSGLDVRAMAVNEEFVYLGSASGCIEVWLRERSIRVSVVGIGSKVYATLLEGEYLYTACEDGKLRVISFS